MPELGVRYGQTVMTTEVQQQNKAWVQIREAIPPNHTPPEACTMKRGNQFIGVSSGVTS